MLTSRSARKSNNNNQPTFQALLLALYSYIPAVAATTFALLLPSPSLLSLSPLLASPLSLPLLLLQLPLSPLLLSPSSSQLQSLLHHCFVVFDAVTTFALSSPLLLSLSLYIVLLSLLSLLLHCFHCHHHHHLCIIIVPLFLPSPLLSLSCCLVASSLLLPPSLLHHRFVVVAVSFQLSLLYHCCCHHRCHFCCCLSCYHCHHCIVVSSLWLCCHCPSLQLLHQCVSHR